MLKAYEDLYHAIWVQAVKDEDNNAIARACYHGYNAAQDVYWAKAKEPLNLESERFKAIKKDIRDYAQLKSEPLKIRIRELVHKEAKEWPDSDRGLRRDREYNDLLDELTKITVEFAEERMAKRWSRI